MKVITVENNLKFKEKLPQVINRIFEICKADPNFPMKEKIESLDSSTYTIKKQIKKQDKLLERAKEIKTDLNKKISYYEAESEELRGKILESLGSEL